MSPPMSGPSILPIISPIPIPNLSPLTITVSCLILLTYCLWPNRGKILSNNDPPTFPSPKSKPPKSVFYTHISPRLKFGRYLTVSWICRAQKINLTVIGPRAGIGLNTYSCMVKLVFGSPGAASYKSSVTCCLVLSRLCFMGASHDANGTWRFLVQRIN